MWAHSWVPSDDLACRNWHSLWIQDRSIPCPGSCVAIVAHRIFPILHPCSFDRAKEELWLP